MPDSLFGRKIGKFGARILILDDDTGRLAKFTRKLIGCLVVTVSTAGEAIEQLKNSDLFDWAFLDHDLNGRVYVESGLGTGYEVARWIRYNPDKAPKNIVIHSFNEKGAKEMHKYLPEALVIPGAWELIKE